VGATRRRGRARRQSGRGLGALLAGVGVGGRVEGLGVLFGEGVAGGRAWQKNRTSLIARIFALLCTVPVK